MVACGTSWHSGLLINVTACGKGPSSQKPHAPVNCWRPCAPDPTCHPCGSHPCISTTALHHPCTNTLHNPLRQHDLLSQAIAAGDYPEWTLCIQTMDVRDEDK